MEQAYKGAEIKRDLPPKLMPIAQKWADALNASVDLMYSKTLSDEERSDLIALAMQTTAAMLAPFEPTMVERHNMAIHFHDQLRIVCDQYFEDKAKRA
jgi:hypothetical protein